MNMLGRKSFDRPMHSPRINRSPREVGSEQGSTKSFCPPTQCSLCFWRWHLLGIVVWLWKNMKTNQQIFEDKMGNCLFSASHKTCHANDIRISDWLKARHAFLRERRTLLMHSIVLCSMPRLWLRTVTTSSLELAHQTITNILTVHAGTYPNGTFPVISPNPPPYSTWNSFTPRMVITLLVSSMNRAFITTYCQIS